MKLSSLLTSGFWTTYGALGTRLLVLLSNLILARLLLPSEFGVISVAYIFWSFLNLFTQGTINSFIVYKGIEDQRYLNTTYTIAMARGLMLAVAMVAISPLAANFFGVPELVWILVVFAFNLLVASIQSVYQGVLTRQMRYWEIANATIIASFVRVVSTTGCAFIGLSYWSFVVGDAAFWFIEYWISRRHVDTNSAYRLIHRLAQKSCRSVLVPLAPVWDFM
ncbi:oligosaccharide flippase family protein [Moorena producens]|uniref:oligosaccharide flippase family protein n=1 Tax=Moorena producens TaxID=1155739 RepID=UPI001930FBE8|nr:oligosaccharide flippase family protein [Moorena producens]